MAVTNGTLLLHYDEAAPKPTMRLGRHMELDARSLSFMIEPMLAQPIKAVDHPPSIGVLDQGNLGSCTGNAGTYAMPALGLNDAVLDGHKVSDGEAFAVGLYHEATVKDGYSGVYPPDDTGSSGLGVCKALKANSLIGSYRWASSAHGLVALLQNGGVIIGMPWYEAFFDPDSGGFIDSGSWQKSEIAGGHELYFGALETWYGLSQPDKAVLRFNQSWGSSWGDHGSGRMRLSTYLTLKSQIDVKQIERR